VVLPLHHHAVLAVLLVMELSAQYVNLDIIYKMEDASLIMEMDLLLQIAKAHLLQLHANFVTLDLL
jgi:hypothetical protein